MLTVTFDRLQFMELFMTNFSPAFCPSVRLRSRYSTDHPEAVYFWSYFNVRMQL